MFESLTKVFDDHINQLDEIQKLKAQRDTLAERNKILLKATETLVWKLNRKKVKNGKCVWASIDQNDVVIRQLKEAIARAKPTKEESKS